MRALPFRCELFGTMSIVLDANNDGVALMYPDDARRFVDWMNAEQIIKDDGGVELTQVGELWCCAERYVGCATPVLGPGCRTPAQAILAADAVKKSLDHHKCTSSDILRL